MHVHVLDASDSMCSVNILLKPKSVPDIALECAGILASLGQPTSLMVRSLCLRSFDQVCACVYIQCTYSIYSVFVNEFSTDA